MSRRGLRARDAAWLAPLVLAHLALARPGLADSIWLDEAVTVRLCELPLSLATTSIDATPPLYYLLVHAWGTLFGCDVVAIRALSLVLSELALVLLFALGTRWFDRQTGLVAATLFVASNLQLYYATEARCYALVELLVLASYWLFFTLRASPATRTAILLGVADAAVVQSHYVAALGLLPQLADVALFRLRERALRRRFLLSQALAAALCVPLATYVLLRWPPLRPLWLGRPDAEALRYDLRLLLGTSLEPRWYAIGVVAVLAATLVGDRERLRGGMAERLTLLALWGVGAPLLAYAVSQVTPIFLPRYLLFASLGLMLLLAQVTSLAPLGAAGRALLAALVIAPTLAELTTPPIVRPDWRTAVAEVERYATPSSRVVVSPEWETVTFAYYFMDPVSRGLPGDLARDLAPGVRFARDPDEVVADFPEQVRTLILVSDETFDHPIVLAMPQMCSFRERLVLHPRSLLVRVLDRDCTIR